MKAAFPVHDGHFDGLRVEEQTATLFLRQSDGTRCELLVQGLENLQMDDFRQGNVVTLLEVISGDAPIAHSFLDRILIPPLQSVAKGAHGDLLDALLARIQRQECGLLLLQSAYGADLVAICKSATFRTIG